MAAGTDSPLGIEPGDLVAEKYLVDRVIGSGGMGVVLAARHIQLDELVAIKVLQPTAAALPNVVERFAREARAAVKIKNEHVVRVLDVGELPTGVPFMVMEHLEGCDLASWIQEHGPIPVAKAVEFILQASEALAEAHRMGIVHRDLKPANLFWTRRVDATDVIKVLDFGISKITVGTSPASKAHLTQTAAVFGSPLYMSPEQMLSARDVDARTDIWALGAVLYELLAGHAPFLGETLAEVHARVSSQPPTSLRGSRPEVDVGLEAVVLRCLEKDRTHRYADVGELALALEPFAPEHALPSVGRIRRTLGLTEGQTGPLVPTANVVRDGGPRAATAATWEHPPPGRGRGSVRLFWAAGLAVVLVAALAAVALLVRATGAIGPEGVGGPSSASALSPSSVSDVEPVTSASPTVTPVPSSGHASGKEPSGAVVEPTPPPPGAASSASAVTRPPRPWTPRTSAARPGGSAAAPARPRPDAAPRGDLFDNQY